MTTTPNVKDSSSVAELTTLLFQQFVEWHNRGYAAPSPAMVKQAVRNRYASTNAVWLETASGDGATTQLLAAQARMMIGIEARRDLYEQAVARFPEGSAVKLFHAQAIRALPHLLPQIVGNLNVWMDGLRPGAEAAGRQGSTSILLELAEIARHRSNFRHLCVMIDGIRRFDPANPDYPEYPTLDLLVDWARNNDLLWHIEHDIFVARKF